MHVGLSETSDKENRALHFHLILFSPDELAGSHPARVDMTRLNVVQDQSESLANALQELSDATRRRDLTSMGRFFDEDLRVESFPSIAGPLTHELKWIERHSWNEQAPDSGSALPAPFQRGEFLSRLGAFLAHFSAIEDVRCEVTQGRFDDKPSTTGEAHASFIVEGGDAEGRREWARSTALITVVGGAGGSWRITRWRTATAFSDVAATDIFSEVSGPAGIARTIPAFGVPPNDGFISHGGAAADLNEDGLIDMVFTEIDGIRLYLNDGNGAFRDASKERLLDLVPSATAVVPLDLDNDGDLDLFLANVGKQHLLENRLRPSGTLTFQNISDESGVESSAIGFSTAAGDVNGDGLPDIYVTAYNRYGTMMPDSWGHATNGTPNLLFVNQGNGRFREMAHEWGVDDGRWSLAPAFADLDGDSRLDLFVANDFGEDALYMNRGGRFEDQAAARGVLGPGMGMGVSFGDPDNDGDLDVGVTTIQKTARLLYRNNIGQRNRSLRVTLVGTKSGRDAFSAVVRVKSSLGVQTKLKSGGSGFLSSHDPRLLFGLGEGAVIEWVEVTWPTGARQQYTGIAAGESLLIHEGAGTVERVTEKKFSLVGPD